MRKHGIERLKPSLVPGGTAEAVPWGKRKDKGAGAAAA
jgi:hypothetical protein